jgi:rare lipoprotein A
VSHNRSSSTSGAPIGRCRYLIPSALILAAALMGCEMRMPGASLWSGESHKLGPRIIPLGQPVPKGGGVYKVGAPYRLNGVVYRPREVDRFDEDGIASWYGEMFHGRRTANGEIYDMEALTAAHPTLPLPSYARVTNLRNGRSLVVRVNDRGPYARGRIIDLSWAVASLLQIHVAGTAPVRVQYLGPAPLDGNDGYERRVLARQPWAGPRVAYARSPAKAMRYGQAEAELSQADPEPEARLRFAAATQAPAIPERNAAREAPATLPPAPRLRPSALAAKLATRTETRSAPKPPPKLLANAAPAVPVKVKAKPQPKAQPKAAAAATPTQTANIAAAYYVEAGLFNQKAKADELAAILAEIAPAYVEPVTIGDRAVHRIRLGPFARNDAANAAVERIRAAGLTGAHVENARGG